MYYGDMDSSLWKDIGTTDQGATNTVQINEAFPENSNRIGDGKFDHDTIPSTIEVPVGRVDLFGLPWYENHNNPPPEPGVPHEALLLRRYLDKSHKWRMADPSVAVERRALVDDHFGFAADSGWRNFAPLVGAAQTFSKDWVSELRTNQQRYLWAYGAGPGRIDNAGGVVNQGDFSATDGGLPRKTYAPFMMLFGSIFGDPDKPSNLPAYHANLLRSSLGSDGLTLTVAWSGWPQWYFHPMGLGEPIGTAVLLSQNNGGTSAEYVPSGPIARGTHAGFLGDPTLRMHVVKPAKNLAAQTMPGTVGRWIAWTHSDDVNAPGFLGYHVYRSASPDGPFVRVTNDYITGTTYADGFTTMGRHTYMVRAVKKETTPSGTYINASTGVFAQTTGPTPLEQQFKHLIDHSVLLRFDRNVASGLSADDLILTRVGDDDFSATVTLDAFDSGNNTATFRFSGSFGSILPDGNYRVTIVADDVVVNDEPMSDDVVLDFFVLGGDADGNRMVNMADYNIMAANFGQTGKNFAEGNFDYDPSGTVNMADYNILAANFGAVLAAPPSGPDQITVSVLSTNEIQLDWVDHVEGETGWRVQRSEDGLNFTWYDNVEGGKSSYTASGLQDGNRYWFRVRAYSDSVENPDGPDTAYTPKKLGTTLLSAPTNLGLQLSGGPTVNLNWLQSAQNAITAVIQRSTNGFNWTSVEQLSSETSYEDTNIVSGTRYYYRVFLKNDWIESAPSYVKYIDMP